MPAVPRPVDDLLDKTVVLSFTNLGYWLRRGAFDDLPRLDGKTVVVTGATSGLGKAAATALASLGARVWLVARSPEKSAQARDDIAAQVQGADLRIGLADLGELAEVRKLAEEIQGSEDEIHALVSNAGALVHERTVTSDGIELTLAVHVVGPFLLTHLLRPQLAAAGSARVVVVASGGMYGTRIKVRDLHSARGEFDGTMAYARAKRAQVILTEMGAELLAPEGIAVSSMHPGWADTPGVESSLPGFYRLTKPFLRSPGQGADTMVWLAAAGDPLSRTGEFFLDRVARPTHKLSRTKETQEERVALWTEVAKLAGVDCPVPE